MVTEFALRLQASGEVTKAPPTDADQEPAEVADAEDVGESS